MKYQSIFGSTRNATAFGRFSYKLSDDTTFFTQLSLAQANVFNYFFPAQQEAQPPDRHLFQGQCLPSGRHPGVVGQ